MSEANWVKGPVDVIILKTKVKVRKDVHDELVDLELSHEEWQQFIDAVKAGIYDLP
jgi:transcription elongation factor GreA-like protein